MLGEGPEEEASKSTDPRAYPEQVGRGADGDHLGRRHHEPDPRAWPASSTPTARGWTRCPPRSARSWPGSPAYEAGMRPGDEIVGDRRPPRRQLRATCMLKVRLSGQGQVVHFDLKRPGQEGTDPARYRAAPRGATADVPGIGISTGLQHHPGVASLPALRPGSPNPSRRRRRDSKSGDRVVAAGPVGKEPTPVADVQRASSASRPLPDKPMNLVGRAGREGQGRDGSRASSGSRSRCRRTSSSTSGSA